MRNQHQGVLYTKSKVPHPGTESPPSDKERDVFINLYEPKGTMYTDQTGKFHHRSGKGNRYQTILHEIDGKCTWIEPMKNNTEGEMILARSRALERMKAQGTVPTHQVLDN